MKILMLLKNHPGTVGGVQTFGRTLKKIYQEELEFLCCKSSNKILYEIKGVNYLNSESLIFRILNKILRNKLRIYIWSKKIKKIAPEICILSLPEEIKYLEKINCKKVLVQHQNYDVYMSNFFKYDNKLIEKLKKNLDYFIFLSEYDLKRFKNELDFPTHKMKVIYHSSNMKLINLPKAKNKKLIMLGRIDNKQKRYDLAILAMKKLEDYTLDIYGNGKDKDYLKKIIEEKNIKNVRLHNSTDRVQEKLDESGIFIMTSDHEGYPISSIEAIRRGIPLIIRRTFESAEDIVKNNGILLSKEWKEDEFIEAVKKIYDNYDYYSENSRALGEKYNFEKISEKWRELQRSFK